MRLWLQHSLTGKRMIMEPWGKGKLVFLQVMNLFQLLWCLEANEVKGPTPRTLS